MFIVILQGVTAKALHTQIESVAAGCKSVALRTPERRACNAALTKMMKRRGPKTRLCGRQSAPSMHREARIVCIVGVIIGEIGHSRRVFVIVVDQIVTAHHGAVAIALALLDALALHEGVERPLPL